MSNTRIALLVVVLAIAGFFAFNEWKKTKSEYNLAHEKHTLLGIALRYHDFHSTQKRPPKNRAELLAYVPQGTLKSAQQLQDEQHEMSQLLFSGRFTVAWGTPIGKYDLETAEKLILFYEYDLDLPEVLVSYLSASTKRISRDEFNKTVRCDELKKRGFPDQRMVELHIKDKKQTGKF